MFYDRFVLLCKKKGVTPTRAALDAGISKSLVTKWKTNAAKDPSPDVIRKLASYFGISIAELLGEENKITPTENGERALTNAELKFALFGSCVDVSDDDLADVRRYAAFVRERKKDQK